MTDNFNDDVLEGLSSVPKVLSSKYFYDKKGDALFQQIMAMPEYYLTDCEMEIFESQTADLVAAFGIESGAPFELIELGAGDGTKTVKVLRYLVEQNFDFTYVPIDISQNVLDQLQASLQTQLPQLAVEPRQGEYFEVIKDLSTSALPKVVFFLGSNLGNLMDDAASGFLNGLADNLNVGDKLLLGLDQVKSKDIVLPAYNDAQGITRAFNLNLLDRINAELGGDFVVDQFEHCPDYNEQTGVTRSFIKSKVDQRVHITSMNTTFSFAKDEMIQTEISRKYNDEILNNVIAETPLKIQNKFTDDRGYYADYLLTKV